MTKVRRYIAALIFAVATVIGGIGVTAQPADAHFCIRWVTHWGDCGPCHKSNGYHGGCSGTYGAPGQPNCYNVNYC